MSEIHTDCTTVGHVQAVLAAKALTDLIDGFRDPDTGEMDGLPGDDLSILRAALTICVMLGPPSLKKATHVVEES